MTDVAQSIADFWIQQGKAMLETQKQAAQALTGAMGAMGSGAGPPSPADGTADVPGAMADMAQANDAMMKLWSAATSMSGELMNKLSQFATAGGSPGDMVAATMFERIADPRQWMSATGELDDVLARMAEGPRLADLWQSERRYARIGQAWTELRRRMLEHQRVVLDAWLRAGRRFGEELARHQGDPKQPFQLWMEVANRELLQTQRSDAFLASQRDMIRASTDLRVAQDELAEHFGKQYGFPTRTEMDDVHRTLATMRRELRTLRRAVADSAPAKQAAAQPVEAPAPVPAPAKPAPPTAPRPKPGKKGRRA